MVSRRRRNILADESRESRVEATTGTGEIDLRGKGVGVGVNETKS